MDYTSFLYDDFALEAADANKESVWKKIANAFQKLMDACSEKIAKFKQTKFAQAFSKAFAKIKSLFNQAQADRENAHEYLRDAREEYEAALKELKEAKQSKNKDWIAYAKGNVKTKRTAYREANKKSKQQWKEAKKARKETQKAYNKMAKDGWGSEAKAAESYSEYEDDADFALEAALNEYDQMMTVANDPSLSAALDNMRGNVDSNCTTAEECANIMNGLNDQIDAFNRHVSTLRIATENYMEDQDKEAFQVTTRNAMAALEGSYNALGLVSESGRFDEACIEQLHNFFDGASQIMADKAEEFEDEDDVFGASESFLGALVQ